MRLLKRSSDGEVTITTDLVGEDIIPPYAILSHTWGADADEVTFEDLKNGGGQVKPGYEKIRFCGEQAWQDGLQYFWIDTCCINKVNKAELSLAIKSMFRWYQNAARCYVYLSDVSAPYGTPSEVEKTPLWDADFRKSRWFTRGWTLQELLAPISVEFFSQERTKLGDKTSLAQQIHETTGIPYPGLQGAPLSQFSVNERLSWKEHRDTTLKEDGAYSLLGIFDVYIAPLYGEGSEGAFKRLNDEIHNIERCIQDIRSTDPHDDKKRIEDTNGGLLEDSYRWVLDNHNFKQWYNTHTADNPLLWIKGDPGKGKTMLLCGIINELQKLKTRTSLLSYFFCQATDMRINSAVAVLRGLLFVLVRQQPSLISCFRKRYDYAGKSLFEDANAWVALTEILTDVLREPGLDVTYLILDAMDECVTDLPKLLDFVSKQSSTSSRVKWIVSSRNWPNIEERLNQVDHKMKLSLELNAESVSTAVSIFIQQKVSQLVQQKRYDEQTRNAVLQYLASNANDTFLWVALVCQHLATTSKRNALKKLNSFPPGLTALYKRMMEHTNQSDDSELCKQVLSLTVIMCRPVTIHELTVLVEQFEDITSDLESIQETISLCGSFLTMQGGTIYFVHQSAKDFLLTEAYKEVFPCGSRDVHWVIFSRSIEILSRNLRRDMYNLYDLGYLAEDVKPLSPDPLAALRYSCIYWVDHLEQSQKQITDEDRTHLFLQKHFLHWLEAMSLIGESRRCVRLLERLWALRASHTSPVSSFLHDANRFVMRFQSILAYAPLQIYCSALVFAPERSIIRQTFIEQVPRWAEMLSKRESDWDACLSTLEGHRGNVSAVAFSPDGQLIASASSDGTVRLWETATGMCRITLNGHYGQSIAIAFSPDGQLVASASEDCIVRIWEVVTGVCCNTLKGHYGPVKTVVFSPDGQLIASASTDTTVRIWEVATGACRNTLEGHRSWITTITFSPDGQLVASASTGHIVRLWDVVTGMCRNTLRVNYDQVKAITFSPDRLLVASTFIHNTVQIWDMETGTCCNTLKGHYNRVIAVAFSPDGQLVASASTDSTVRLWEVATGVCRNTLEGHSNQVVAVSFSPDGQLVASASTDSTVRLWEVETGVCRNTLEGHSSWVTAIAFSSDGQLVASASRDRTVRIWEAAIETYSSMLEDHSSSVTAIVFSPDGELVASASQDWTIRLWNVAMGMCYNLLEGHSGSVTAVAFSPDGHLVASASKDWTVRLWDVTTGICYNILEAHTDYITTAIFSPDGRLVASASEDRTVRVWDAVTGMCCNTMVGHSDYVRAVAFSPDGLMIISASKDRTIRLWDSETGTCYSIFDGQSPSISHIDFSWDGQGLHTNMGDIRISLPSIRTTSCQEKLSSQILVQDQWILRSHQPFLWLPFEYRPAHTAVRGNSACLGYSSGRVILLRFK